MDTLHELHIDERCRKGATAPAALADFVVTAGEPVETEWLIENPHVNLYTLDTATSQAIFVETAPEVNLAAAPFVYNAQYEGAQRLFAMPYSHLLALGERLETKLDRLILLFNLARCGSTLLHQLLNQVPGVVSVSEPDRVIPFWSQETLLPVDEAGALMRASAKFLFRRQAFPDLAVPAIKFRGRNLRLLEIAHAAFPDATLLFLYRDAIGWVESWAGVDERLNRDKEITLLDEEVAFLTLHLGPISLPAMGLGNLAGPLRWAQQKAFTWLALMDCYLKQERPGLPVTAWRYSDLNQRRRETLTHLFTTCGLPLETVELALAGYERDSQAGTVMARAEGSKGNARRLSAEEKEEVRAFVGCHPIIQRPDFVAPNTMMESGALTQEA